MRVRRPCTGSRSPRLWSCQSRWAMPSSFRSCLPASQPKRPRTLSGVQGSDGGGEDHSGEHGLDDQAWARPARERTTRSAGRSRALRTTPRRCVAGPGGSRVVSGSSSVGCTLCDRGSATIPALVSGSSSHGTSADTRSAPRNPPRTEQRPCRPPQPPNAQGTLLPEGEHEKSSIRRKDCGKPHRGQLAKAISRWPQPRRLEQFLVKVYSLRTVRHGSPTRRRRLDLTPSDPDRSH